MFGRLFAVAIALASAASIAHPSPTTALSPPATTEHECAACHSQAVAEWEGSLHHRSFSDADFAAGRSASGSGFTSFPPIANETGYGSGKDATFIYDKKHDFSQVRDAIKETPSLTSSPLPTEARDAATEGEAPTRIALVELRRTRVREGQNSLRGLRVSVSPCRKSEIREAQCERERERKREPSATSAS